MKRSDLGDKLYVSNISRNESIMNSIKTYNYMWGRTSDEVKIYDRMTWCMLMYNLLTLIKIEINFATHF